jgi:GNAT superfamily N-acetyltransferase
MWGRLLAAEFRAGVGDRNKRALRRLVGAGEPPGLIAYVDGEPAAWCALAPREVYRRIENSRTLARVDDSPVWSVPCFFVARPHRKRGLTVRLLREAIRHARSRGATILEGYPVEPKRGKTADVFAWTGLASAFRAAGFREVARRSPTRPIMRCVMRAGPRRLASAAPRSSPRPGAVGRSGRR